MSHLSRLEKKKKKHLSFSNFFSSVYLTGMAYFLTHQQYTIAKREWKFTYMTWLSMMSSMPSTGELNIGGQGSPPQRDRYPFIPPLHTPTNYVKKKRKKHIRTCKKKERLNTRKSNLHSLFVYYTILPFLSSTALLYFYFFFHTKVFYFEKSNRFQFFFLPGHYTLKSLQ